MPGELHVDECTTATVPADVANAALDAARRRGIDVDELLRAAGISASVLGSALSRVTSDQASAVLRRMWDLTDDELFGLGREPMPRGSFRMVAFTLVNAVDLGSVLARMAEFGEFLPGHPGVRVRLDGDTCRVAVEVEPIDDDPEFLVDFLLTTVHRFLGWMVGQRIPLVHVEVPYRLSGSARSHDVVFGAPVLTSSHGAALTFSSALLSAPVIRSEAEMIDYMDRAPDDIVRVRDYGSTTGDRVRRILEHGLRGDWPSPDEIAARLTTSPQNLRRQLRDEGTSITDIKQDVLRDAAITSLVTGDETVADLSSRLGFSEPSAFHRAFRRWTGSTPRDYRRPGAD
ncbi:AraC family transcriptional regulator [Aeromicrobium sp. P5_D10]